MKLVATARRLKPCMQDTFASYRTRHAYRHVTSCQDGPELAPAGSTSLESSAQDELPGLSACLDEGTCEGI